jgi:hypothetical protein
MDIRIQGKERPLIPEGVYDLRCNGWETMICFGKAPKLRLDFVVHAFGNFYLTQLSRFYNVKELKGKPSKNGKFVAGRYTAFTREFLTLFPHSVKRLDRIPMSEFKKNVIIRGRVGTVTKTQKQKDTPRLLQYSVIKELLGVREL